MARRIRAHAFATAATRRQHQWAMSSAPIHWSCRTPQRAEITHHFKCACGLRRSRAAATRSAPQRSPRRHRAEHYERPIIDINDQSHWGTLHIIRLPRPVHDSGVHLSLARVIVGVCTCLTVTAHGSILRAWSPAARAAPSWQRLGLMHECCCISQQPRQHTDLVACSPAVHAALRCHVIFHHRRRCIIHCLACPVSPRLCWTAV